MLYREFKDKKLSLLGFGGMRLPLINGEDRQIDEVKTAEMIDTAMKAGINYYDTAYGYHEGNSERVMGKLLAQYPRESYYLASKFPGYDVSTMSKPEKIFEEQLAKCEVEYFDFYLFHNICEQNIEEYLDREHGLCEYIEKQRELGRIKHIGFSVHGDLNTTKRFMEVYGHVIEFAQIQLNYIDYEFQDAKGKMELFAEYGIPVWVMEPVRGGKLVKLEPEYLAQLQEFRPDASPVEWAFRFVQSLPQVMTILSGMSDMEQLEDNIRIFSEEKPLNETEINKLLAIAKEKTNIASVPCTACRYCTTYCPQGLDIPTLLELYNEYNFSGGGFLAPMRIGSMPEYKRPSACIECHSCEAVCPQQISISETLAEFNDKLSNKRRRRKE